MINTIFFKKRVHITGIPIWISKSYKKDDKTQHLIWVSTPSDIPYQVVNKLEPESKDRNVNGNNIHSNNY